MDQPTTERPQTRPRVVVLTGTELRHRFAVEHFARSTQLELVGAFCEVKQASHQPIENEDVRAHFERRADAERAQFAHQLAYGRLEDVPGVRVLPYREINEPHRVAEVEGLRPDYLFSFGCSLIKSSLLQTYAGRFVNMHLGLSPYYRGSGTNFWPFANGELQFVGATFMHIDAGVDTGSIIHQVRAGFVPGDDVHSVGNRLIDASIREAEQLLSALEGLNPATGSFAASPRRVYRRRDFTAAALGLARDRLGAGLVESYLARAPGLASEYPILQALATR